MIEFEGRKHSLSGAMALLIAGASAFFMGFTNVFFVEAMAWIFLIWGALLLYANALDITLRYQVTEDALVLYSPVRFWGIRRVWDWGHIHRLDVEVLQNEASLEEDVVVRVYYTPEGSVAIEREDMPYYAELARLIVEKAGLKPQPKQQMTSFDDVPLFSAATYTWKK